MELLRLLGSILLLLLAVVKLTGGIEEYNFDETVAKFAKKLSDKNKQTVVWHDIYGRQPDLKTRSEYRSKRVTIGTPRCEYGKVQQVSNQTKVVLKKWFKNMDADNSHDLFVQGLITRNTSLAWKKDKIMNWGFNVSKSMPIPNTPIEVGIGLKVSFAMNTTNTTSTNEVDQVHLEQELSVPPMTAVLVEWSERSVNVEAPWYCNITASGWIAVRYKNKVDGQFLQFYDVTSLAEVDDSLSVDGKYLVVQTTGTFEGLGTSRCDMRIKHYPISEAPPDAMKLVGDSTHYGSGPPSSWESSEEEDYEDEGKEE